MKPCREYSALLAERAAGALPSEAEARLSGHLESCGACRAEAAALAEALSLAALPPASEEELRALDAIAGETLRALRDGLPRRTPWRGIGVGLAFAAAAAAAVIAVPALRHGKGAPAPAGPAAVQVAWQEPDLDDVWEASGAVLNGDDGSDDVPIFADVYDPDSM